jgi:hypothetical protein
MSGHRVLQDMKAAIGVGLSVIADPGDGETIRPTGNLQVCNLTVGAGAESRSLPLASDTGVGLFLLVFLNQLSGGTCTVGTATFTAEGDFALIASVKQNGVNAWKVLAEQTT